ncbi:MAG: Rrf2 family transcriptional regulator [Crocinitomicaceae bacterium]
MFTKACEYGIRACVLVALHSMNGKRISLKEIAKEIDSPLPFTAKILQKLVKNELIYSIQGAQGGFEMATENFKKITIEDIVIAIDGDAGFTMCVLGLKDCSEVNPCPAHKKYKHIKADFKEMIKSTNILEMVTDLKEGVAYLKID